jgi:YidC/Oxa1 family membrane protein insertase
LSLVVGFSRLSQGAAHTSPIKHTTITDQNKEFLQIQNALINYEFSSVGGALQSAFLYFAPWGTQPEEIIQGTTVNSQSFKRQYTANQAYSLQLSLGTLTPAALYKMRLIEESSGLTLGVEFTYEVDGIQVTKLFTVHNDATHTIDLALTIKNTASESKNFAEGYKLALGTGVHNLKDKSEEYYVFDGKRTNAIIQGGKLEGLGFLAAGFALWLTTPVNESLKPYQEVVDLSVTDPQGTLQMKKTVLGVQSDPISLISGQEITHSFRLYTGRIKFNLLELTKIQHIAEMSWWDQFLVPVANFLNWLFSFTGNYAWAILLFTLLTRIILFPLTRSQYHAMAKMVQLQPRLQKLQQRYPGLNELKAAHPRMSEIELKQRAMENRQEMTKRMMELYKKEGANPLGGCLPMLLQFPILIILWQAITYDAEQIHLTSGFLWMPDLSLADPLYIIVLLTVGAMIAQSKMTPTPGAQQNQVLIWIMPILMGVMLKDFASGLWIYYFLSTVMQLGQQVFINWELKREAAKKPALAQDDEDEETPVKKDEKSKESLSKEA